MIDYEEFVKSKEAFALEHGFEPKETNPKLFEFQRDITKWSIRRGRAAIFADCGLGKTPMQLEWAKQVNEHTGKPVLIFAPLAVSKQTKREGRKFKITVNACRSQEDIKPGINITNYEMLHKFKPDQFGGLVLDESSILKGFDGKFRKAITKFASKIQYRLACTATPAPNDLVEIINHAEFLGIMREKEIKALFFTNRGQTAVQSWVLKDHAQKAFWTWLSSWAVAIRKPSDLGYDDGQFELPDLDLTDVIVEAPSGLKHKGFLGFHARDLQERRIARRTSINHRVQSCVDLIAKKPDEQWLVWCDLNQESDMLKKAIPGAVEIKGADSREHKETAMLDFQKGKVKVLVTKPSIAGFGMNWQNCHNVVFVGLSDSYEKFYQAIRRCWRFGQTETVNGYIIIAKAEGGVLANIKRKEQEASSMMSYIIKHMDVSGVVKDMRTKGSKSTKIVKKSGDNWTVYNGDSVQSIDKIEDESVGLIVFSPPFPGMYAYTDSPNDMGNSKSFDEMLQHFDYLIPKMLDKLMPGRSCCIHLCQGVAYKAHDGYIGIKDFRGRVIQATQDKGWIYYGEVCIDKNPQVKAVRTKDRGLLFKTLSNDAANLHMALADYILQFRKPGENPEPIKAALGGRYNGEGWITPDQWIEWAAPVWYRADAGIPGGIRETDVLENYRKGRTKKDERHIAPLQLGVIERCIKLWSNPGDLVYSPFTGIGSEGYMALKLNRRFVGGELKKSYFDIAVKNLKSVQPEMVGFLGGK